MSVPNTVNEAKQMSALAGKCSYCDVGDAIFETTVHESSYRTQKLHYASGINLQKVIFIAADANNLLHASLISIPSNISECYKALLERKIYSLHLSWAYSNSAVPAFAKKLFLDERYTIKSYTIDTHFNLWKKRNHWIDNASEPLPVALQIVPYAIALWNKIKAPLDVM